MRSCTHFEPELSAFLDGELSGEQARAVASHVDACPACSAEIDRLRAVGGVLRRWDAEETRYATTNAFRARVLQSVGADHSDRPEVAPPARHRLESAPLLLVRAAAAAVIIVSVGAAYALTRGVDAGTDLAQLEATLLRALQERNAALDSAAASDSLPAAASDWTVSLDDSPWGTVVTPREDTPAVGPRGSATAPEVFEEHGDVRILRDAFPHWDRVQQELRALALREDVLRLKADRIAAADRPTTDEVPVTALGRHLGALQVAAGDFAPYQQVQVWPIIRPGAEDDQSEAPLPVDAALGMSALRVTEGEQADALFLENTDRRGRSVLILAGDVFHGARRDRVAMEDVLLRPGQERHVRALGTGDARRRTRRRFSRSDGLAPQRIRALIAQGTDQSLLDRRVADVLPPLGLASGNGSLDEIFGNDQLLTLADDYVRALSQRLDGSSVVGFAVAAGGDLLGIEVFPNHGAFSSMRGRVLRSYVIEALARPRLVGEPPARDEVTAALRVSSRTANLGTPADDASGAIAAFVDPEAGIGGFGLLERGSVVHAVIFDGDGLGGSGGAGGRARPGAFDSAGGPTDLGEGTGPDTGPTRGDTSPDGGVGSKR